ncbi:MAG: VTT domain-containing protein [Dehalococcoidia bacterium]
MSEDADLLGRALDAAEDTAEVIEEDIEAVLAASEKSGWFKVEYLFFALVGLFLTIYVLAYFVFDVSFDSLRQWGYLGIFLIAMAGSATIVLPTPSNLAIFGSSAVLDPVFGIPAPLMVGLVAGLGDAIGEFSGYVVGFAGQDLIKNQKLYRRFEGWMDRRGMLTIFLLCTFPNPTFDLVGAAAGAARMHPAKFFIATLGGKIVKDVFLAYGGSFSIGLFSDMV